LQCNASANKLWVEKLEWTGQEAYLSEAWRDWFLDGKKVGEIRKSGLLTVATASVNGAGHMMSINFLVVWFSSDTDDNLISSRTAPQTSRSSSFSIVLAHTEGLVNHYCSS
jgi:hypothetical protein